MNEDGIYLSLLTGKEKSLLVLAHSNPGYANGCLFYLDDKRELRTVSFNLAKRSISGEPQIIANQVAYQPSTYWGAFSAGGKWHRRL